MTDVRITDVDLFDVRVPDLGTPLTMFHHWHACVLTTDAGITGYSFHAGTSDVGRVRSIAVGRDLFDVDGMLAAGLPAGVEHAVWDAIGKVAGLPVHKLFGSSQDRVRTYLTTVWQGRMDQSDVTFDEQAAMAVRERDAGFAGMKIRAWRPDPFDDVKAMQVIRDATGPDFAVMFDRTAAMPGQTWDADTAIPIARALDEAGATWLEEPLGRHDYAGHAKLAAAVEMPITGGEGWKSLAPFREILVHKGMDIVQPDPITCGGILPTIKVAAMAEAFGVPTILHGFFSLPLAAWLQVSSVVKASWQELVYIPPPFLPEELLRPAEVLLASKGPLFEFEDGHIKVPQLPGLGLDIDPDALQRYRVR